MKKPSGNISDIFSGEYLVSKLTPRRIIYIVLFLICAVIYIGNVFASVSVYKEIGMAEEELENIQIENLAVETELLTKTNRRENVIRLLEEKESTLQEPLRPPYRIVYKINETKTNRKK